MGAIAQGSSSFRAAALRAVSQQCSVSRPGERRMVPKRRDIVPAQGLSLWCLSLRGDATDGDQKGEDCIGG